MSSSGLKTTFAKSVDRKVLSGKHAKSSSGIVKYKIDSEMFVKYCSSCASSRHSDRNLLLWSKKACSSFTSGSNKHSSVMSFV